ncbi:hypothetical protein EPA93_46955 [Ktedonosporobacter rubrisoli]|uniref:Uncharacterized protein n=1 Tax=Ktedonosporobacter rubrisoli TaxID=2509675 RepID=A0A4P6K698_KTERU|nr:hypothetical protein [Ktedonosporobacter rubrisoli]QBD83106.1 hypothetical protein EPA93_46955 [Ktedonosporobacter rubrisoli]
MLTDRYLPVPMWNNRTGQWEPVDFRHGQKVVAWPTDFDPSRLPAPEYRDGDRVQFIRDETCTREGVVRMVLLRGGTFGAFDSLAALFNIWYCDPENITYIVTARNHDHAIHAHNIIGRFVSYRDVLRPRLG